MLVIPDFAQPVVSSFAPVFYHPTYQRFLVLLVAAVLTTGRRTVSNLLRTSSDLAPGHPSTITASSPSGAVVVPAIGTGSLAGFILDRWVPNGTISVVGDDTVNERRRFHQGL